jgi:hypothetical protein
MGNKLQNNLREENDIDKIKSNYLNYKERQSNSDEKYINLNLSLHALFNIRFNVLFDEKYLKVIKEKIELFKKDEEDEEIKKMKEIVFECESLKRSAFDDYLFYCDLLHNLKEKYINNSIITKENYEKMCEDIIDSIINTLIKFEKELCILRDKIIQLNIII